MVYCCYNINSCYTWSQRDIIIQSLYTVLIQTLRQSLRFIKGLTFIFKDVETNGIFCMLLTSLALYDEFYSKISQF
jgi:hypothetical protein